MHTIFKNLNVLACNGMSCPIKWPDFVYLQFNSLYVSMASDVLVA